MLQNEGLNLTALGTQYNIFLGMGSTESRPLQTEPRFLHFLEECCHPHGKEGQYGHHYHVHLDAHHHCLISVWMDEGY